MKWTTDKRRLARDLVMRNLVVSALVLIAGCGTPYILPSSSSGDAMTSLPEGPSDRIVGIAISGGGSRAATFASAVLKELSAVDVGSSGSHVSFLEKIGYVSSVSGGSLAAAYYALKKPSKDVSVLDVNGSLSTEYAEFFQQYRSDMHKDWENVLWKVAVGDATRRANAIVTQWDRELFNQMTFRDLRRREAAGDAPRMILNGTSWDSGRRFLFTTLPRSSFSYDFVDNTAEYLKGYLPDEERRRIVYRLETEKDRFRPITFEEIGADPGSLKVSVAVASSSSVPLLIGPVLFQVGQKDEPGPILHIGDGGMFDNQGMESLAQVFFGKLRKTADGPPGKKEKKGLILVIDASFPFISGDDSYGKARNIVELLEQSPSRISDIMEERAQSYQLLLWAILRADSTRGPQIVPDPEHLEIVYLRHIDGASALVHHPPEKCQGWTDGSLSEDRVREKLSHIPTRFKIDTACDAPMLEAAAKELVTVNKDRIVDFFRDQPAK